jgi:predicted Zn-dependent peptidase
LIQVIKRFLPAQSVKKHDEIKLPGFNREPENKIIIKHKKDSGQTNLRIGKLTINPHHSDFPGLQFANTVFGGFFLSRLNKLLREELGYTYGVSSYINSKKLASVHIVSTSINKESTGDTIKRIIEQMDIIRSRKISDEEYILVRQYLLGSFLRSTETSRQVAGLIKNLITGNLPKDYYTDFYNRIKNITIDEIFNCQNKYFSSSKLTIAAVGDKNLLIESIG